MTASWRHGRYALILAKYVKLLVLGEAKEVRNPTESIAAFWAVLVAPLSGMAEGRETQGLADKIWNGGINLQEPTAPHVEVTIVGQDPTIAAIVNPRDGTAESEIRSLVWLRQTGNELLRAAYEEWQRKDTLFAKRVDKKRLQSSSLRNEIYQLIGFYSVFQGVLLTAVAQSNLLFCYNLWTALLLSLFASLVTILAVFQKFKAIYSLEKTIKNESNSRQDCIVRCAKLLHKRGEFTFTDHAADRKARPHRQWSLLSSIVLILLVLLGFSTLFGLSIERILCHSNDPSSPPTTSS